MSSMIPDRYNKNKLKEALRSPEMLINEVDNLISSSYAEAIENIVKLKYGQELKILSEDWDNLIILDACRYDIFSKVNCINGELKRVVSSGSSSREFLKENFQRRTLNDTVYITGNPHCHTVGIENVFYDIIYSYDSDSFQDNKWNKMTVAEEESPKSVYTSAVKNLEEYRNKRKIIHFMQPHAPYHGSKAKRMRERLSSNHGLVFSHLVPHNEIEDMDSDRVYNSILHTVADGWVSPEEMKEIYTENLKIVLGYVKDLLDKVEGKTVITADHGELLGFESRFKRFCYPNIIGHPGGSFLPELRLVPWLVIDAKDRPEINSETQVDQDEIDQKVIDNQLKALGYK